jgi:transposase
LKPRGERIDGGATEVPQPVHYRQEIGEQLGINPETLRGWVSQAEIDAGSRPGTSTDTAARLAELERETANCGARTRS